MGQKTDRFTKFRLDLNILEQKRGIFKFENVEGITKAAKTLMYQMLSGS